MGQKGRRLSASVSTNSPDLGGRWGQRVGWRRPGLREAGGRGAANGAGALRGDQKVLTGVRTAAQRSACRPGELYLPGGGSDGRKTVAQ